MMMLMLFGPHFVQQAVSVSHGSNLLAEKLQLTAIFYSLCSTMNCTGLDHMKLSMLNHLLTYIITISCNNRYGIAMVYSVIRVFLRFYLFI